MAIKSKSSGQASVGHRSTRSSWVRGLPLFPIMIIGSMIIAGIFAPWIAPHDFFEPSLTNRLSPPSPDHWMGTDSLGRDVFSRVLLGARVTLIVVALSLAFGAGFGLLLGIIAGYMGGVVDSIISRIMDAMLAFPPIFFGLLFAVTLGAGIRSVTLALSLVLWARFARVIRGDVLSIRERDFVSQAVINGASTPRILALHILPNVANTFMVLISVNIGSIIIAEASLSFLGAGIPPPNPSWGSMIASGQDFVRSGWWLSMFPGLAITLVVLSLNLFGDWVRDVLDPRLRDQL